MWRSSVLLLAVLLPTWSSPSRFHVPPIAPRDSLLLGRWDVSVQTPAGERPSWLELEDSGRGITVGRLVGIVGSSRPITRVAVDGDSIHFAIPPQWEDGDNDLVVDGRLTGERFAGSMLFPDGKRYSWTAVRAPLLHRAHAPSWGTPIHLLHARDLGGWHAQGGEANQWQVKNGILSSPHSGANIETDRTFNDFKLHIEFRYPKESNSGVYLRGRYEVQIQDDYGLPPWNDRFSGIYGFIAPTVIT